MIAEAARRPSAASGCSNGSTPTRMVGSIAAGCVAAFVGTLLGARLVKKITLKAVRVVVGVGLLLFGVAMAGGLV